MRSSVFFFISILFLSLSLQGQTPEKINYQGIARDNSGAPMSDQLLGIRIKILDGNTSVYTETHHPTTNNFGLYTLAIGDGTPISGTMSNINWSTGNKFINIAIDPYGGTNYSSVGTTELLSVPYALYAATSGDGGGGSSPTGAAGGDLTGTYPDPSIANAAITTEKLSNNAVNTAKIANGAVTSEKINPMGATNGQVLKFDGTTWVPAEDETGTGGNGDDWGSQVVETDTSLEGEGTETNPLRLAQQNAVAGQVLQWNGTAWIPITLSGDGTGDDWGSQVAQTTNRLTGDGTLANPLDIAQQGAVDGQVLKWNGTSWTPADDEVGSGGGDPGDDWGSQTVETDITLEGEGTVANPLRIADNAITTNKIANNAIISEKLDQMGASTDQFLKWNGTTWIPSNLSGGTGDNWGSQTAETDATIDGDGTTANPLGLADAAVTGVKIDQMSATDGQVLKWNGTTWEPADDEVGSGDGGDDWGNQVTETDATLTGDGTVGNELGIADNGVTTNKLATKAVTSEKLDQMGASNDQVLTWNGTTWVPDDVVDGAGDDWGSQVVETDATLNGDGTIGNELGLAQNGATDGQILTWNDGNSNWIPTDPTATAGGWALNGNTVESTDFIGTTNDEALRFKQNSLSVGFIKDSNTTFGLNALPEETTGFGNTSLGANSLNSNTDSNYNTAIGYSALKVNTTGQYNTANGSFALTDNTTGSYNTAMGLYALAFNTTGQYNTATGHGALNYNTIGDNNTATGEKALYSNTEGNYNTAIGTYALKVNTTGNNNTSLGFNSLASNTTGDKNTASGQAALFANTTGAENIAMGYKALVANTSGNNNTAMGSSTLESNTTGEDNTALGADALGNNQTGNENTALGGKSMSTNISGNGNTTIGYRADVASDNLIHATAIGYKAKVAQDNSIVLGSVENTSSSPPLPGTNVGIGTTVPEERLHVVGNGKFDGRVGINYNPATYNEAMLSIKQYGDDKNLSMISSSGISNWEFNSHEIEFSVPGGPLVQSFLSLYLNNDLVGAFHNDGSYESLSDRRLKENILPTASILNKVKDIKIMNYNFKSDKARQLKIGYIAQELEKQFPEFVTKPNKSNEGNNYYTVNYAGMSAVAIKAIQEQQEIIEAQTKELQNMHKKLNDLEARLLKLEK